MILMTRLFAILALAFTFLFPSSASAESDDGYDVFVPIAKYIEQGDSEKLSAWFADNLELTVLSHSSDSSRNQARQIMKAFFNDHTPTSFTIAHMASKSNMKYAIGTLVAGAEVFQVTLFLNLNKQKFQIQQMKIEIIK